MKNVEDRLRELPSIAENMGVDASQQLKYKIRNAARDRMNMRRRIMHKWVPVLAMALVVCIGLGVGIPALHSGADTQVDPLTAQAAGEGTAQTMEKGALLDVPQGSIAITTSDVPDYRSIWAKGGANFPLVGVDGKYYRMLTTPGNMSGSLKGEELGQVALFTDEPSLASPGVTVSNTVAEGESIYAVSGMNGALVCANVEGSLRVFQRVGYGDSAIVGGESLRNTLCAGNVIALELSGVGSVRDSGKAKELLDVLCDNAVYQRAGGSETAQSLLIYLSNGLTLQLSVNGEKLIGCGTWACPDFFDAFESAISE